ncbi:cystathionine beta-lyase [Paucilactobacillus hokkaidonensis JCM 18461]|uniref:cysteine-S-conjugate beta-lyase n=2 Tax=Paucilactobacillus hokkaidonensis TaxID=1193095 RepID=A0A0A1GUK6_9LACO|nr:aminotransferase class I/II-fold pyridoxal phosphate-dependent enzyme [Paucilactobacillus hokkaidonensis]KRO09518.1 cystathionine beta-lyase [Paucilactobacillus hokkaidonensis]BAP84694.1 cystathionine beta-lyase [Paucilactobacillus hokkaidonensis JCM 18461]
MDFNTIINRVNTDSAKWAITDQAEHREVTAMTTADMDFATPSFIRDSLLPTSPILGYIGTPKTYFDSIIKWQAKHHHLTLTPDQIIPLTGVLPGLSFAIRTVTKPNDNVLIFDPVYAPFSSAIRNSGRHIINSDLTIDNEDQYCIDFDKLEHALATQRVPLMILCNPQNPSGHLWTKADLTKLVSLAKQYHTFIISDEIHQDLVYQPAAFTSLLELPDTEGISLVISAATKTFNMPGVKNAYMFVKDEYLANQINALIESEFGAEISTMGLNATTAAMSKGERWHDELIEYLRDNRDTAYKLFTGSSIVPMLPQSTYLMWLDFSKTGLSDGEIDQKLINDAKVQLNLGAQYGENGEHWFRMNFATPKQQMIAAIKRIITAFK